MKRFKCYDCELTFETKNRDDILKQLYNHYMKDHNEIITDISEEGKKQWMERFEKDWAELR
ncbi:MAG: DUF1059 domain-containing protein [Candidatus Paceibacterota bacterium]